MQETAGISDRCLMSCDAMGITVSLDKLDDGGKAIVGLWVRFDAFNRLLFWCGSRVLRMANNHQWRIRKGRRQTGIPTG